MYFFLKWNFNLRFESGWQQISGRTIFDLITKKTLRSYYLFSENWEQVSKATKRWLILLKKQKVSIPTGIIAILIAISSGTKFVVERHKK